jgi:urease accessory protein
MNLSLLRRPAPGGASGLLLPGLFGLLALLAETPALAHHFIEINDLRPTLINGLLSGLAHPLIGPDHLLFLLALSLVGLQRRAPWMGALLLVGLGGSAAGLLWPQLPGSEALVALTLVVEALVLLRRLPAVVLVPAMALHGYVLSEAVLGWSAMPVATYLSGLVISQGLLLIAALVVLQRWLQPLRQRWRTALALALLALGGAATLAQILA